MNFKNISLFVILFAAGFVGTTAHADDEVAVKMSLEERMAYYKEQEFVVCYKELLGVKAAYEKCQYLRLLTNISCQQAHEDDSICMYAKYIKVNRDRLKEKYSSLKEELEELQNEIREIKDELGISYDSAQDSEYQEYSKNIDEALRISHFR